MDVVETAGGCRALLDAARTADHVVGLSNTSLCVCVCVWVLSTYFDEYVLLT